MNDDDDEETATANGADVPPAEHSDDRLSSDATMSTERPRLDNTKAAKDSS
jgi:hypothetical protein